MNTLRSLVLLLCLLFAGAANALSIYFPQNVLPQDSGLYYAAEADGSGVQINAWKGGSVFTWYTFDKTGAQVWLVGVEQASSPDDGTVYEIYRPSGLGFLTEDADIGLPIGTVTMTRYITIHIIDGAEFEVVDQWIDFKWNIVFSNIRGCEGFSPMASWCAGKYTLRRLNPVDSGE